MKDIPKAKLKAYLLMIFLFISLYGAVLDVLFTYGDTLRYLDLENMYDTVYADSTDSGFNFFTDSIDISIGVALSWEDVDVSAYVPAGSTGVILEMVSTTGLKGYDVRKAGSTDDLYEGIVVYTDMHKFAYVGLNSSLYFQMYIMDTTIDCYLIGYMDTAVTMFTNIIDYSVSTALSWEDVDLSVDVPATATGVIMRAYNTGATLQSGVRHPSSTDNFHLDQRANAYQLCGVNSSRMIQAYAETLAVDHYLVGYTESPIQFNTNWDDVSLGVTGAFTNIDVTAHTTANATGVIIYIQDSGAAWYTGQIREDGSTDNRITDAVVMTSGQTFGACGLGTGEILEGYISNVAVDMYVVGYCAERPTANIVYPDHIESSNGVTNATHSLADNETWAEFDGNGWAIYDFASEIANVTAIRWEIAAGGVVIFRIEGSNDMLSWDTLVQMEQTYVGTVPPTHETNSSTRYDSEVHGRYRYFRLRQVKPVIIANDFWVDYICLIVTPPSISYADHGYFYPTELEYFRWDVWGASSSDTNYASRPYNTLGENQTDPIGTNRSTYTYLVNADDHPGNYLVVKMDDFYNITRCEMRGQSGTHFYLYVSQYSNHSFTLVDDWTGISPWAWYGYSLNASYIRYIKVNATGVSTNTVDVEAFRLTGVLSGGAGPGVDAIDQFSFILLPDYLGDLLGIGLAGGQFLSSLIILSTFLLPIAVYDKKGIIALIVGVACFGFLVLLGWLPSWLMLIMVLLVAGIFAFNFSSWFGGKR
jgi:hypothetical protein